MIELRSGLVDTELGGEEGVEASVTALAGEYLNDSVVIFCIWKECSILSFSGSAAVESFNTAPFSATAHRPEYTASVLLSPQPGAAMMTAAFSFLDISRTAAVSRQAESTSIGKFCSWAITVAPASACSAAGDTGAAASAPNCAETQKSLSASQRNSSCEEKSTG